MEKRRILKHRQILIAALFGVALLTGWCFWQNKAVRTTVYVIESSKLKPDAPDITIIQISDLHNAEFGDKQEKLIRKIKEAKPDIIAVTGDLIDSNHTDIGKAMELISQAVTIAPVYFVTGNHEAWAAESYIRLKREMENAGVHILDGISETFSLGGQQICLMGAKDPAFFARTEYEAYINFSCPTGRNCFRSMWTMELIWFWQDMPTEGSFGFPLSEEWWRPDRDYFRNIHPEYLLRVKRR